VRQAAWGSYQLTSVDQDADAMIEATAALLLDQIDGKVHSSSVVLPVRLVVRGSTLRRNSLKGKP